MSPSPRPEAPPPRPPSSSPRGRESFATQTVALGTGNAEATVSLDFTPVSPARRLHRDRRGRHWGVPPWPTTPPTSRSASIPNRSACSTSKALRYEYKYLKARLEDDPDVSLVSIVRRANPDRPDAQSADGLLTPERLKSFDIVILGDMEASYLSIPEYQALLKWLDEKDHALLALGGYRSFGPDGFRTTPLAEARPVVCAEGEPYQSEEAFSLQLTDEGRRHPIFALSSDRVQDAATWTTAPSLRGRAWSGRQAGGRRSGRRSRGHG